MTSGETPAAPSAQRSSSGWRKPSVVILGIAFWILVGATLTFGLRKPQQGLHITNTGSRSVDVRNSSASWGDDKVLTLLPGMTGVWTFRDLISSTSQSAMRNRQSRERRLPRRESRPAPKRGELR
jgi:hypothetical protein